MNKLKHISFATIAIALLLTATQAFATTCPGPCEPMPPQTIPYGDGCTITFTPCVMLDSMYVAGTYLYDWTICIGTIEVDPKNCLGNGEVYILSQYNEIMDSCFRYVVRNTPLPEQIQPLQPCSEYNNRVIVRLGKPSCVFFDTAGFNIPGQTIFVARSCGSFPANAVCLKMYFICRDESGNTQLTPYDSPNYEILCPADAKAYDNDGREYSLPCYSVCK